jgi:hypothetical protein
MQSIGMALVVVDKLLTLWVENASPPTRRVRVESSTQCSRTTVQRHKSFTLRSRGMWLMMCSISVVRMWI